MSAATFAGFFSRILSSIGAGGIGLTSAPTGFGLANENARVAAEARGRALVPDGCEWVVLDAHREIGHAQSEFGAAARVWFVAREGDVIDERLARDLEVRAAFRGVGEVVERQRIGRQFCRSLLEQAFGRFGL